MSDTSRWTPISGRTNGRMFGIYREPDPDRSPRTARVNYKLLSLLVFLAVSALVVCFVSLIITRTGFPELSVEPPSLNVSEDILQSTKTPQIANATASGDGVQETLSRPIGSDSLTENYPQTADSQEERSVLQDATTHSHSRPETRRVRAYMEDAVKARIVNRQRSPGDQVGAAYSQLPSYGDEYAQLEGYRNPPRGIQDVMSWVERPGVKFTGVYFKSEDKPYLNGHAYVSDPFVRFKPSHPSEINQLAVEADRGTRFSNRPDPQPSGSHTQAIFQSTTRPRPLKIMLDIYPMIPETPPGAVSPEFADLRGRRPKTPTGPAPNRMIVHLNLYPKKSSRISRRRPSLLEKGLAQQRMFEGSAEKDEEITFTTTEDYAIAFESTTEQTEIQSTII